MNYAIGGHFGQENNGTTITHKVNGADVAVTELTEENDGEELTVKLSLTMPYGASSAADTVADNDNITQDKSGTLNDITLTLKQVHAPNN